MNKAILMGRLVRDPEIRQTGGEESTAIARYTLAVARNKKTDDDSADFFSCTVFGKGAEFAEKYLRKGMMIMVVGKIKIDSYTNKEGKKVRTTQIIVDEQEFAQNKKDALYNERPSYEGDFSELPEDMEEDLPFK